MTHSMTPMSEHRLQSKSAAQLQAELEFMRRMYGRVERNRRRHHLMRWTLRAIIASIPISAFLVLTILY